jgi:hypothetical protein
VLRARCAQEDSSVCFFSPPPATTICSTVRDSSRHQCSLPACGLRPTRCASESRSISAGCSGNRVARMRTWTTPFGSVPGINSVVSITLLVNLPELGTLSRHRLPHWWVLLLSIETAAASGANAWSGADRPGSGLPSIGCSDSSPGIPDHQGPLAPSL